MKQPTRTKSETTIGGKPVTLSNPDRVLWPREGYTKGDLVDYYRSVSKWMLPYLKDRPVSLERYPSGISKPGFFEKNAPAGLPPWVPTITLEGGGKRAQVRYVLCNDEATLAYLANLASITLHVWMSRVASLDTPDFLLFDLDRGERCSLKTLATVALAVEAELRREGMRPQPKTTGGSGLHVYVWLRGGYDYARARDFIKEIALRVQARFPKLVTLERMIAKRPPGSVYLDWVQLGRGKTVVMPFVVRARAGAPVSMPLRWADVARMSRSSGLDPAKYFTRWNIKNVPAMLRYSGDPWKSKAR
ncbi:MAG: non-homologous end-joining DNA ligase [Candidatus Eremiobacteraeota bacterium]|nr:non-homologous end-joining DNA ligase [Candidatus Eremiobacteraeota bacterium]